MSNVHGLYSNKKDDDSSDEEQDDSNNRYVGGVGDRGGGSGLAVQPNKNEGQPDSRDSVFAQAESATPNDNDQVRRTIIMYRNGFIVDDGPYRRLDDAANAEFLRDLARGQTPRELMAMPKGDNEDADVDGDDDDADGNSAAGSNKGVVVGLVDKRDTDYEEQFTSFSGAGTSLGGGSGAGGAGVAEGTSGVFDPANLAAAASEGSAAVTAIQIRLPSGARKVVRLARDLTVGDLAAQLVGDLDAPFQLVAGFPPQPLTDPAATIEAAGLTGAQVTVKMV